MSDQKEDEDFVTRVGPFEVDWPRSLGYFAGVGIAVALELITPPLGLFIAAVPFLKLLKRRGAPATQRALVAVLEGVAKPVGGDSESTIRLAAAAEEAPKTEQAERSGERREVPATPTTLVIPVEIDLTAVN